MTLMVAQESITVVRAGKRTRVPLNKPFNFTDDEITYLRKNRPEAIRRAIVETPDEVEEEVQTDEEINGENEQAEEELVQEQIEKAGTKVLAKNGAAKAVKTVAAKKAAAKVDDL